MNFGFLIDNRKCIGCHACTVACKAEHDIPLGVNRTWVKYVEKGEFPNTRRLFSVMRCNHCSDAPCVEICPVTALFKRQDGIVDFDNRRCIGCRACMQACPYDALYIDPETRTAAKCNYCAHRVAIGLQLACVNVCPEYAIISGDMDDPLSEISRLLAREPVTARKLEKATQPKLFYIEGDQASLKPTLTQPSQDYLWSSQAAGVGHFAPDAAAHTNPRDAKNTAQQLHASGQREGVRKNASERSETNVWTSYGANEKARRVYDSPSKGVMWGWEVAAYICTKAMASGSFLVPFLASTSGLVVVSESAEWLGYGLGLLFLVLTGLLLVKDLDRPERFAYVLLRPQWGSWLVRGGCAITAYGLLLAFSASAKYFAWKGTQPGLPWVTAILAVITAIYTAFLFAQARGRDFWQSPTLLLHMLVHAIMAGATVFGILAAIFPGGQAWNRYLQILLTISIACNLAVIAAELLIAHPTEDAMRTVQMIVAGRFRSLFWMVTVLVGNVAPLLLVWIGRLDLLALASVLVLLGVYSTEHIWVRAPQLVPLS